VCAFMVSTLFFTSTIQFSVQNCQSEHHMMAKMILWRNTSSCITTGNWSITRSRIESFRKTCLWMLWSISDSLSSERRLWFSSKDRLRPTKVRSKTRLKSVLNGLRLQFYKEQHAITIANNKINFFSWCFSGG
jgi:hypothetical protein